MAAPYSRSLSAVSTTPALSLDHHKNPFSVAIAVTVSGTNTSTVQYTLDDPNAASVNWFNHPDLTNVSANAVANLAFPVRAVRLNTTAWTSGTATLTIIQAGR